MWHQLVRWLSEHREPITLAGQPVDSLDPLPDGWRCSVIFDLRDWWHGLYFAPERWTAHSRVPARMEEIVEIKLYVPLVPCLVLVAIWRDTALLPN